MAITITPTRERVPASAWRMLALGVSAQAAGSLFLSTPAYLIPLLHLDRGVPLAQAGLLAAAPSLGMVLALVAWGAAADRYGERWVIAGGLALTAAFAFAAAARARLRRPRGAVRARRRGRGQHQRRVGAGGDRVVSPLPPGPGDGHQAGLPAARGGRRRARRPGPGRPASASGRRCCWRARSPRPSPPPARSASPTRPGRAAPPAADGERPFNPYRESLFLTRIHLLSALLVVPQFTLSTFGLIWLITGLHWNVTAAGAVIAAAQFVGALGRIGVGVASDRVGSRTRVLRWVAVSGVVVMLALAGCGGLHWAVASAVVLIVASTVSVADNGLSFTSVAEAAGPSWSGKALGIQNTGQFIAASAVGPGIGALITAVGYPVAFALVALTPLAAIPLVPPRDKHSP